MKWIMKKIRAYRLHRAMSRVADQRRQAWRSRDVGERALRIMEEVVRRDMEYDRENGIDYDLDGFVDPECEPAGGVA